MTMRWKNYKPGDRIFYENYDGTIGTNIVKKVENKQYTSDKGYIVNYQWLCLDEYCGIENYNCIPANSQKIKDLAKSYKEFDKVSSNMITYIMDFLSPFNKDMQMDFVNFLQSKVESE